MPLLRKLPGSAYEMARMGVTQTRVEWQPVDLPWRAAACSGVSRLHLGNSRVI